MHYLAFLLDYVGFRVAVNAPCYFAPHLTVVGTCQRNDIAIYPDAVPSNLLNAPIVVRYMLYFPSVYYRQCGGVGVPAGECVAVYSVEFLEDTRKWYAGTLGNEHIVFFPSIEASNWLFPERKDIENVIYVGKKTCAARPKKQFVEIQSPLHPSNDCLGSFLRHQSTMALLRRAKNFYTMDHYTAMCHEANLCGCNVFKIHGENDVRKLELDSEKFIMKPKRDAENAIKLHEIICNHYSK